MLHQIVCVTGILGYRQSKGRRLTWVPCAILSLAFASSLTLYKNSSILMLDDNPIVF